MNRRWLINRTNPEFVNYISRNTSVSYVLAQILINRGIKTIAGINDFLNPGRTCLSDPFDLPGMQAAIARIKAAMTMDERVIVHGDYDADGLTATSILLYALRKINIKTDFFIPNRIEHGYGFNPLFIEAAKKCGARLIITVDCGISSFEAAERARAEGIDVIITDHHEPVLRQSPELNETRSFLLPDAVAVVNPKLMPQNSQLKTLSGAGIAFKIAQAMALDKDLPFTEEDSLSLLDLACLGTIADVVAITGENRVIIKEGLNHIKSSFRPGIRALKEVSRLGKREIKAGLLSYTLVPRINAAGRLGDATEVVNLFLCDSAELASSIAVKLDSINIERQRIEEEAYQEAIVQLNSKGYDSAIVLHSKAWNPGVIGIVASRIAEEFYRPVFIFSSKGDTARGSARSIPAFNLYEGLALCRDLLISFGGHRQAAGINLQTLTLPLFEKRINGIVRAALSSEDFTPAVEIDASVSLSDINNNLLKEFSLLEPFGYGNQEPLLGSKKIEIMNPRLVGKNHLKMRLRQGQQSIDAIGFDLGGLLEPLGGLTFADAAFIPTINEWNNSRTLQLNVRALRPSSS